MREADISARVLERCDSPCEAFELQTWVASSSFAALQVSCWLIKTVRLRERTRYNLAVEADEALGRCAPSGPRSLTPDVGLTAARWTSDVSASPGPWGRRS